MPGILQSILRTIGLLFGGGANAPRPVANAPVDGTPADDAPRNGRRPFYVVGHRGSPCVEVENTIPSFERALEHDGANGIELDLCITSDGVVVVWHDWDPGAGICIARCSGLEPDVKFCPRVPDNPRYRKPVNQLTFQEFISNYGYGEKDSDCSRVDAQIPSFEQLMRWVVTKREMRILFLDIKIPADELQEVPRLMRCIEEAIERWRPQFTIVFETAHQNVLDEMKRYNPDHFYTLDVVPAMGIVINPSRFSAVRKAIENGNCFCTSEHPRATTLAPKSVYKRMIRHDMALRERHNSSGRGTPVTGVIGYTVNDEAEMRRLIGLGIDGIQSDRPDLLRRAAMEMHKSIGDNSANTGARRAAMKAER